MESPAGGVPYWPFQLFVAPPAIAPSADCSHWMNSNCRPRLIDQSLCAVAAIGVSAGTVDSAQAASRFW